MKRNLTIFVLLILLFPIDYRTFGQDQPEMPGILKFFLDCDDCDFTFVSQKLDFITFVRDPNLADVHILMSKSTTGNGGKKYFLDFIGLKDLKGQDFEYEYPAGPLDTDDDIRRGLLKRLKTGILQYYSKSDYFDQIEIDLSAKERSTNIELDDPWEKWVFRIEAGTDFQKEESKSEYTINSEIRIEKVTETWKTRIEGSYQTDRENFFEDDEKIVNKQNESDMSANYIKSLTTRWSAGIFAGYESKTYLNIKDAFRFYGAMEYNIFPWDISNRKIFTLRYKTGIHTCVYYEETIYEKTNEVLYYEAFELNLELVQPWGTIESSLEWMNYFHDFTKNRLTLDSEFSVRLTKQFSIYGEIEAQLIHDQLYLPLGENTSLEDILLKRRKQSTGYEINGEIGLRFTFGSIYNSVINERF